MDLTKIYHICSKESWLKQTESLEYVHDSLKSEKFIHCSEEYQIKGVLTRYFTGNENLLLIKIDPEKVIPLIKYEKAPIGEYFPHIYGSLNKDAIIEVHEIDNSEWI